MTLVQKANGENYTSMELPDHLFTSILVVGKDSNGKYIPSFSLHVQPTN